MYRDDRCLGLRSHIARHSITVGFRLFSRMVVKEGIGAG
jgi:hypothetical protein